MSKTWFISDTHFGHSNIIKYDERPFGDIKQMEDALVENWNKKVKPGDTVWFLGDFAFINKRDYIEPIVRRLNGIKNIVLGNHDTKSTQFYRDCGFNEAYNHPVILKNFFILSHEPVFITENMPYFNIYGHVHNHSAYTTKTKNTCCVCCSRWNYEPVRVPEFDGYNFERSNIYELLNDLQCNDDWDIDLIDTFDCSNKVKEKIVSFHIKGNCLVLNLVDTDCFIIDGEDRVIRNGDEYIIEYKNTTNGKLRIY